MTPVKQLFRHEPENGIYGDCFRAVLASLLDVDLLQIPHEHRAVALASEMPEHAWLADRGLMVALTALPGATYGMEEVLGWTATAYPGCHLMFAGTSKNDCNHVVIIRDGAIVWDPALDDSGIVGPCDDGNWYVEVIARRL